MTGTDSLGTGLDYGVMLAYFALIVVFGLFFGRYTHSTNDFFFGGQRFSWWLIAFSAIASTVGSYSFVKYSEVGFRYGLSSTQSYLNDWFWMPILLFIWLPIIYYQRVTSVPEYLDRRFGRANRIAATCLLLVYLVGYIGINLLTLGRVFETLLGWPVMLGAGLTALAVTLYVITGGQTSVIMTDLAQGIILLATGLGLFFAGVWHLGGFGDFWSLLPQSHKFAFSEFAAPDKFSFLDIYAQDGLANTGAFVLINQGMIMRFLSLKSVREARRMAVCWALILAPIAALTTSSGGWIARALTANGELDTSAGDAFVSAAHFLCRPGVFGFVLAALTAALMSTADTLINAVSAVFVNDIWRPYVRPNWSDRAQLRVARITSLMAGLLGLLLVPVYARWGSIYEAHAMFTAAITPPLVVAVFFGILWKRFTPTAAFVTLVAGFALIMASFPWNPWGPLLVKPFAFGMGPDSYTYMRALYGLVVCTVIGLSVTFLTKARPAEELVGLVSGTQMEAIRRYKGGEANRTPGKKARLPLVVDESLSGSDIAILPQSALDTLFARPGDVVYLCDPRWWFGGLRSVHLKAAEPGQAREVRIGPEALETSHLISGQDVIIEKIL
ncbi:MAG TPA: sodium/solute symporter [Candidatus Hydrogenedentes bacterium]|nr:sodium/solute symporter [Candidatus Hydrogenedentota bacterium]HPG68878.1 sodium/solute symporter [Candidatus Hydrogenedentota bacterium]